ncbi:MAG: hypothetical protein RMA76_38195 [Deltaproteobacteria bacterium]
MAKTFTCEGCGAVEPVKGGRPRWCIRCRPTKHRQRDLNRLEKSDPDAAAEVRASYGADDEVTRAAIEAAAPKLLALGLTIEKKPEVAAAVMGLSEFAKDPEWLKRVTRLARKEKALLQRKPAAIGELGFVAIGAMVIRALTGLSSAPPSQFGTLSKALAQTLELLQGGSARPAYTELNLVVPGVSEPKK